MTIHFDEDTKYRYAGDESTQASVYEGDMTI